MSKDDYIRFRCSTDLKELVEKQAEEKGMNITDYMEYLIRRDGENMIYVHYINELDNKDLINKIINDGLAVPTNENLTALMSKVDKISINGEILDLSYTLENYIKMFGEGEYITLVDGIEITKRDAINTLIGELYQLSDDNGTTYAEKIFKSKNPDDCIRKYINDFLLLQIDFKMTDIQYRITQIKKEIEDGIFEWE